MTRRHGEIAAGRAEHVLGRGTTNDHNHTLQPHAVRELTALDLLDELSATGIALTELAYFTERGQRIRAEPRGLAAGHPWAQFTDRRTGAPLSAVRGDVLVGADGVHSAVRRVLHPGEGPPPWTGITMWRGTTEARLAAATMVGPRGLSGVIRARKPR